MMVDGEKAATAPFTIYGEYGRWKQVINKQLDPIKGMMQGKLKLKGLTLIPLRIYFNARGRAKIELGLGRGKKQYDKRQTIKERDAKRETARAMRSSRDRR